MKASTVLGTLQFAPHSFLELSNHQNLSQTSRNKRLENMTQGTHSVGVSIESQSMLLGLGEIYNSTATRVFLFSIFYIQQLCLPWIWLSWLTPIWKWSTWDPGNNHNVTIMTIPSYINTQYLPIVLGLYYEYVIRQR